MGLLTVLGLRSVVLGFGVHRFGFLSFFGFGDFMVLGLGAFGFRGLGFGCGRQVFGFFGFHRFGFPVVKR